MFAVLKCPNCELRWSAIDCAAREKILCDCGLYLVVPDARSKAIAAASSAAEAVHELLAFAREGNQLGDTAFSVSVGEMLADAFRLSIEAQGGPDDDEEARFYAAAVKYLDPAAIVVMPARPTFPQKQEG